MQRHSLGEAADRQKIQSLLKGRNPGWMQTRLCALKMGLSASNTKRKAWAPANAQSRVGLPGTTQTHR